MKRGCDFWASKHNIPNLKLYTQLIGVFYSTLGLNFLLCFLYWKYIMNLEHAGVILAISISMFVVTPVAMTDEKRENRDLFATVTGGIMHGMCTIGSMVLLHFKILLLVYVLELIIVILLIIRNYKINHGKKKKGRRL